MSNHFNTDDMMYFVKPSRLNRKRRRGWQDRDPEVERAIAEWQAEAQASDAEGRANG